MIVDQYLEEKSLSIQHLRLPSLTDLRPVQANKENRQHVVEQLRQLDSLAEQGVTSTELLLEKEDLTDMTARQLLILQKMMTESEQTRCFHTSQGGKLIEISNEKMPNSKADIHVTFEELFTAKLVMDILGTNEVTLDRRKKDTG